MRASSTERKHYVHNTAPDNDPSGSSTDAREVEHLFDIAVAAISEELGVQAQAPCGEWQFTNFGPGVNLAGSWKLGGVEPDDCPVCLVVADLTGIDICDPVE